VAACRRVRPLHVVPLIVAGCTAALCAMGGEPRRTIDVARAFDAGSLLPEVDLTRTPPDPEPLVEREQWAVDLRWDRGDVWLLGTRHMSLPAPQPTPRAMGRFALELFEGPTLIERVRFDFPLLGVPDPPDAGFRAPPSFVTKLRTRVAVVFPATPRGTRLELWDRATGRRWSLPWPLDADAGPPLDVDAGRLHDAGGL
jgi:hypothetical protein